MSIGNLKRVTDCTKKHRCLDCSPDLLCDCLLLMTYKQRGSLTQYRKLLEAEIAKKRSGEK